MILYRKKKQKMLQEVTMKMKQILIRADDLGYSEGVNYGIAKAVNEGVVKSVGVMPNMPYAKHGLELLHKKEICLGQHTNICVGRPITNPKRIPSLCNENGMFKSSREYREAKAKGIDFVNLDEVVLEIEAQYNRFVELTGKEPGYFEGHAVASDNFFKGLEIVAQKFHLPYLAMRFDGGPVMFRNTEIYSYMPKDFKQYEENPFSAIQDAVANAHEDACDMMVFHPGYIDNTLLKTSSMTIIRAMEAGMLCEESVKEWLAVQPVKLVTYDDLK